MRRYRYQAVGLALVATAVSASLSLKKRILSPPGFDPVIVVDREGTPLRRALSGHEGTADWVDLDRIPPALVDATVAAEDRRFFWHPGIDPFALARAAWQNLRARRVVSGGSTLTQQLIRVVSPRPRTLSAKICEMAEAAALDAVTRKKTLLTHYLNRVPYGNRCYGAQAAARLYFNKPAAELSLAQCAFLAGLPQSPTRYNPYERFSLARQRQERVLLAMERAGKISSDARLQAERETLTLAHRERDEIAPHFCEWVLAQHPTPAPDGRIHTTLDAALQADLQKLAKTYVHHLRSEQASNAAIVVLDNRHRSLRAMVGSADYFDDTINGQVNGAVAPRTPGSTWKPFTYGLAFERGIPASRVIPDLPLHAHTDSGDFSPRNFDETYHGPVRLRTALACSYNIPAVRLLSEMGVPALWNQLRQLGFAALTKPADFYGLGMTLGGAEASLLQMAQAYAAFANQGVYSPAQWKEEIGSEPSFSAYSPEAAALITDILSDNDARVAAFGSRSAIELPFSCAVKTGTSKNFRDSLTVGYTVDHTVAVWVGNFDGRPMKRVSGSTGAAPLFREVMLRLYRNSNPTPFPVPTLETVRICPRSGLLPTADCPATIVERFVRDTEPATHCDVHRSYRIDIRNGLLATSDCSDAVARTEIYEVYDPIYRRWADQNRLPGPPSHVSPLCVPISLEKQPAPLVSSAISTQPSVLFPQNGDVFLIDPVLRREYQTLLLQARTPPEAERTEWLVDGEIVAQGDSRLSPRWPLSAGRHHIRVRVQQGDQWTDSADIHIRVLEQNSL